MKKFLVLFLLGLGFGLFAVEIPSAGVDVAVWGNLVIIAIGGIVGLCVAGYVAFWVIRRCLVWMGICDASPRYLSVWEAQAEVDAQYEREARFRNKPCHPDHRSLGYRGR